MIKRVEHVGIMATDMDGSIRFYENLLGFQIRVRVNNGQKELVFLTHEGLPGFEIELIRDLQSTVTYSEYGLVNHLAFVVDDLDQVISRFEHEGITFLTSKPKQGIGRKTIRFKGPNGEILQLVEERMINKLNET
ncbi:VOC family protein [Niallia oryzisoli]|uniref:VOC family protein n=1 Tax=Niallia oryzisoli TaxID=1737571 RepID=UPI003736F65F